MEKEMNIIYQGEKGASCLSHLCLASINHKLVNVVFNNLNSKKEFEKLEDKKNVIIQLLLKLESEI